jgi:hypothetical protein
LSCGSAQASRAGCLPMRRSVRALLLFVTLAGSVIIALPPASAQGIPNTRVPTILPAPPAKIVAPATVPGTEYDCPTGYAKPDLPLRIQNLKVCLPVGSAGLTPSGGTAAATVSGQRAPAPSNAGARTLSGAILTCRSRVGFYSCGRNAMECCPLTQDNPCFAGAYACKADASQGGANRVCCLR